tara:strand:+ start:835 stop:1752 length:918 start_codon:yes stop_codon:yes gene_type:complete
MKSEKILITGSNGLVGSALTRYLKNKNYNVFPITRKEADLFNFDETLNIVNEIKPTMIINSAARVGGILANNENRTEFIIENLKINMNLLESIKSNNDIKFINLGSSCIYPLNAPNPIKEESIMSGHLEPTNSPYAMAKLTAIEIGDAISKQHGNTIINLMPTNLYGPNDNFDEKSSHVIPGLIARMHNAKINNSKEFKIWGTGKPLREFLFVNDFADAVQFIIDNNINEKLLNIGSGKEISILDLVKLIKNIINFEGELTFDFEKPDGNPRKLLDSSKINSLGWSPKTELIDGIEKTYNWYKNN